MPSFSVNVFLVDPTARIVCARSRIDCMEPNGFYFGPSMHCRLGLMAWTSNGKHRTLCIIAGANLGTYSVVVVICHSKRRSDPVTFIGGTHQ